MVCVLAGHFETSQEFFSKFPRSESISWKVPDYISTIYPKISRIFDIIPISCRTLKFKFPEAICPSASERFLEILKQMPNKRFTKLIICGDSRVPNCYVETILNYFKKTLISVYAYTNCRPENFHKILACLKGSKCLQEFRVEWKTDTTKMSWPFQVEWSIAKKYFELLKTMRNLTKFDLPIYHLPKTEDITTKIRKNKNIQTIPESSPFSPKYSSSFDNLPPIPISATTLSSSSSSSSSSSQPYEPINFNFPIYALSSSVGIWENTAKKILIIEYSNLNFVCRNILKFFLFFAPTTETTTSSTSTTTTSSSTTPMEIDTEESKKSDTKEQDEKSNSNSSKNGENNDEKAKKWIYEDNVQLKMLD